jgi:hypothetical protein
MLFPCQGEPRIVTLSTVVNDNGEFQGDTREQLDAMTILVQEPGSGQYGGMRQMAQTFSAQRGVGAAMSFVGMLDSSRTNIGEQGLTLGTFFLGADNGHPLGLPLFPSLSANEVLGDPIGVPTIRGPVLMYAARWVEDPRGEDGEIEAMFDWPDTIPEHHMEQLKKAAMRAIKRRYRDAGLR